MSSESKGKVQMSRRSGLSDSPQVAEQAHEREPPPPSPSPPRHSGRRSDSVQLLYDLQVGTDEIIELIVDVFSRGEH